MLHRWTTGKLLCVCAGKPVNRPSKSYHVGGTATIEVAERPERVGVARCRPTSRRAPLWSASPPPSGKTVPAESIRQRRRCYGTVRRPDGSIVRSVITLITSWSSELGLCRMLRRPRSSDARTWTLSGVAAIGFGMHTRRRAVRGFVRGQSAPKNGQT